MTRISKLLVFFSLLLCPLAVSAQESAPDAGKALQRLKDGNANFVKNKTKHPNLGTERRALLRTGQNPLAVIVSCSDSRVPPEIVFDQGLGDLFVVRSAGNTVEKLGLGSIEYAVAVLNSPLIVVMGHEYCGAVAAAMSGKPAPGHIADVVKSIGPALPENSCQMKDKLDCGILGNIDAVVSQIQASEPILAPLVKSGKLQVVGAYYDFESGKVLFK